MLKNRGALQDHVSPVDNVQGVEVAQGTCNFSSIEPGSGLQKDPFSLKMVEQLEGGEICQDNRERHTLKLCLFGCVVKFELTSPPLT